MAEWAPAASSAVIPEISFRFLQPHFRLPFHAASTRMLRLLRIPVERVNTRIENVDPFTKQQLRKLCAMPRMSTFAMGVLINRLVTQMAEDEAYVNVGVWHGFTYFAGVLSNGGKQCIAVDNYSSADRFSGQRGIRRLLDYYPRKAKSKLRGRHSAGEWRGGAANTTVCSKWITASISSTCTKLPSVCTSTTAITRTRTSCRV